MLSTLILAPHPDDEVFWCYSQLKPGTKVIHFAETTRLETSQEVLDGLGVEHRCLHEDDMILEDDFILMNAYVEQDIKRNRYSRMFIPCGSYHQDHQTINKIGKIQARPLSSSLKKVYEYPYVDHDDFRYNTVVPVNGAAKIQAMDKYLDSEAWIRYVIAYNGFVAAKYGRDQELMEPFRLLWSSEV